MIRGTRCPRCRGPVARSVRAALPNQTMGSCLSCGAFFPVREPQPRPEAAIFSPALDPWVALAGCVVVVVLLFALLAHLQILGGVLLILIGVGIVVTVGAYEAGYLDGPSKALRAGLPELRRSLTGGKD